MASRRYIVESLCEGFSADSKSFNKRYLILHKGKKPFVQHATFCFNIDDCSPPKS